MPRDLPSAQSGKEALEAQFACHLYQPRRDRLSRQGTGLVDLRKKGVGRLRDDSSCESCQETGTQVQARDGAR